MFITCVCSKKTLLTAPVLSGLSSIVERRTIAVSKHRIAANHTQ